MVEGMWGLSGVTLDHTHHQCRAMPTCRRGEVTPRAPLAASTAQSYADPDHPNGTRQVMAHNGRVTIKGRDEKNGSLWVANGDIQGNTITLDFSSKGGPASITATYNNEGITFADGNTWVKHPQHHKIA